MKEITVRIPEKEYRFFMKLLKSLGFVKLAHAENGDGKEAVKKNLEKGFEEMKAFKKGEKQGTPINDFLNEL